jgi:predicted outer membrane repeat protein
MSTLTNRTTCLMMLLLLLAILHTTAVGKIIYVDDNAAGANNGSSWENAYLYLQDALADANSAEKSAEIRVAQGIYKPDLGSGIMPGDKNATFRLISGVAIYGGYAGLGESDPDEHDVDLYKSILSGDLESNDVEMEDLRELFSDPTRNDNSRHVLIGSYTDETAVLDGFTITGGRSIGAYGDVIGGAGIGIEAGGPTITNCVFTGNASFGDASALVNRNGSCPSIINCTFSNNFSLHGAMENYESSPMLAYCKFSNNSEIGIQNRDNSYPILVNCTFENNITGISSQSDCNITLTDCTFIKNSSHGIEHEFGGKLSLTGCVFRDNMGSVGVGINSHADELTLTDCLFIHNIASGWGSAINYTGDNFKLKNCEFRANSGRYSAVQANGGVFIVEHCIFSGNVTEGDGGAIEISGRQADISNCLFAGNVAGESGGAIDTHYNDYTMIRNCTFSGNTAGYRGASLFVGHSTKVTNCIFWSESPPVIEFHRTEPSISYCNVQGGWFGEGNTDVDPRFVELGDWDTNNTPEDPNDDVWVDGDYHLSSQAGRWDSNSQSWVMDDVTSPCIDAGDPNSPIDTEPFPNGGRVNMGAYGASVEASKTYFGSPPCQTIIAGDINGDCVVDFEDLEIIVSHWMMQGDDFVNKPPTVRLIEPQDGDQIAWPGPTMFRTEVNDVDGKVDEVTFHLLYKRENYSQGHILSAHEGTDGWQREYTWPGDITDATWTIWVEAIDNEGEKTTSPPITITLYHP